MEIGLVPFIITLGDPFVQFLLREIDPDYSEELELLLHSEGSRAEGVCLGLRDSVGHLLVRTQCPVTINGNCSNLSPKGLKKFRSLGVTDLSHST